MNKLLNSIFYYAWRLLNLGRYISYLFSTKTKINMKSSYIGILPELEDVTKRINTELMGDSEFLNHVEEAKKSTDDYSFKFDCFHTSENKTPSVSHVWSLQKMNMSDLSLDPIL